MKIPDYSKKRNKITYLEMIKEIARLNKGYCELKEKCNKGECDCTHEEYNNMCEENIKMDLEIQRLKEEYVMLQNASDKVEEEKDKEIERQKEIIRQLDIKNLELTTIINNLENELARVYEIELDYPIQFVKEEVEKVKLGVDKE